MKLLIAALLCLSACGPDRRDAEIVLGRGAICARASEGYIWQCIKGGQHFICIGDKGDSSRGDITCVPATAEAP